MKLKRMTKDEFNKVRTSATIYNKLVNDFLNEGDECAEVIGYSSYRPENCTMCINKCIKDRGIVGVKAHTKGGRVFLIKEETNED